MSTLAADAQLTAVLLRMLTVEAPVEDFERLLASAQRGVDDDARLATLRDSVRHALEVRELLATRRRREQELAALYETAGDLSSLRELEPVLAAIVRRAHQLLGTDATYLMLNDTGRAKTYMRVTEGITTDAFKAAELALGAGLGGLVAATGRPYATADYGADERFLHTIDDLVSGEGLVAILGVPLKSADRVIGVLFAADRRRRPFTPDEVALLASLADHAAIALDNATLFNDLRSALSELRRASAVIAAHSETVERAAAMHERLTALVLGGGGLPDLADAVSGVLGSGLLVLSARGRLLARSGAVEGRLWEAVVATGGLPESEPGCAALRDAVTVTGGSTRTVQLVDPDGRPAVVAPVVAAAERLGALVAVGQTLDDTEVRSLERAAMVTALLLITERSVAEAEQRVRGELFDDLLGTPQRDGAALRRRAAHLGVQLDAPHVVAVVDPRDDAGRRVLSGAAAALAAETGGLSGEHQDRLVLLLPGTPATPAADLARRLGVAAGRPVTVGVAGPAAGSRALAEAYRDAVRCHDVLVALGREGDGATPDELGVYALLFSQAGRAELGTFVRRTVGAVVDYDARRGSDLVGTLAAYFARDGNLTRTAADLYVHVNTLYQRLDRVAVLLGDGWRHGDQALQVHLALKVHLALRPDQSLEQAR